MQNLKMPDLNNVTITGNLTNDPTFRRTNNGTPVANFYIASNRKFKDNSGQWKENVCFVGIVAWHKLAESCYEYLAKGSAVLIEGELQSRTWKFEDGSNNHVVEIKARRIQFLNKQSKKDQPLVLEENDPFDAYISESEDYEKPDKHKQQSKDQEKAKEPNTTKINIDYDELNF
ncbi:MAG: single-stranded DNA-binding protein [bacterium]